MPEYKVGDTVVHSTFGSGKIVALDDKGSANAPLLYYVIETGDQILWVPVDEDGKSSLHPPTSVANFNLLFDLLRSEATILSNNPYRRNDQLAEMMLRASPRELCLVVRDLTRRSGSRKLSSHDVLVLNQAKKSLLDEWQRTFGDSREQAGKEMGWILSEIQYKAGVGKL